jgi:hypothetical protein
MRESIVLCLDAVLEEVSSAEFAPDVSDRKEFRTSAYQD